MRRLRRAIRSFYEKIRKRISVSVLTLGASGVMLGIFAPPSAVLSILGLIACHEAGHYLAARRLGAEPEWPTFWAFWRVAGGRTTVRYELSDGPTIALAGPIAGVTGALCLFVLGAVFAAPLVAISGVYGLVFEVLGIIFGADGRAFREDRRELRSA